MKFQQYVYQLGSVKEKFYIGQFKRWIKL